MGVAPQLQPLQGMLLRRSTDIYPKELARHMREFQQSPSGGFGRRRVPIAGSITSLLRQIATMNFEPTGRAALIEP